MPIDYKILKEFLSNIKKLYEDAIIEESSTESIIRSSELINNIHEFAKIELRDKGIDPQKIFPPIGSTSPEKKIIGFLKGKRQDITVLPEIRMIPETMWSGKEFGKNDPYGIDFIEKCLTINIRSQLSSIRKNFDTLYERSFAESLNLHLRVPTLVLGEIYMIPTTGYNYTEIQNGNIIFDETNYLLTFITSYGALNKRIRIDTDFHRYERVCLLIVDFSKSPPKVINTFEELKPYFTNLENQILTQCPQKKLNEFIEDFQNLTVDNFFDDLLNIYNTRHNIRHLRSNNRNLSNFF